MRKNRPSSSTVERGQVAERDHADAVRARRLKHGAGDASSRGHDRRDAWLLTSSRGGLRGGGIDAGVVGAHGTMLLPPMNRPVAFTSAMASWRQRPCRAQSIQRAGKAEDNTDLDIIGRHRRQQASWPPRPSNFFIIFSLSDQVYWPHANQQSMKRSEWRNARGDAAANLRQTPPTGRLPRAAPAGSLRSKARGPGCPAPCEPRSR